jgi:twitching motility two-component system response regulator PilH
MGARILIVDDSPTDQHAMSRPLEASGFAVDIASSGKEALTRLETASYDAILLDVIMPDQNGFQLCRQLRNDARFKEMPIIMVTSKDQPSDRFWGMKQGATEYVTKPFDNAELVNTVRRYT